MVARMYLSSHGSIKMLIVFKNVVFVHVYGFVRNT